MSKEQYENLSQFMAIYFGQDCIYALNPNTQYGAAYVCETDHDIIVAFANDSFIEDIILVIDELDLALNACSKMDNKDIDEFILYILGADGYNYEYYGLTGFEWLQRIRGIFKKVLDNGHDKIYQEWRTMAENFRDDAIRRFLTQQGDPKSFRILVTVDNNIYECSTDIDLIRYKVRKYNWDDVDMVFINRVYIYDKQAKAFGEYDLNGGRPYIFYKSNTDRSHEESWRFYEPKAGEVERELQKGEEWHPQRGNPFLEIEQ